MRVVRPEVSEPRISEIAPRGKPSIKASSGARPVGSASWSRASGRNPSVVVRAAVGFMQFRLFFAIHILHRGRESCQGGLFWEGVVQGVGLLGSFGNFCIGARPVTGTNNNLAECNAEAQL